jgi:uncharacterized membrane protein
LFDTEEEVVKMSFLKLRIGMSLIGFLKATIVGGLLFLLPAAVVLIILRHAMNLAGRVAEPISSLLPDAVISAVLATVLAALLLVLICFLSGLVARTRMGKRIMRSFETSLLGSIPQYQLVKSMAEGLAQVENAEGVKPALVSIEGGWQLGYLLEPLESGWVTVFLPQAPTPMAGNVMYMPADRVRPLDISMVNAMAIVKRMGVGSRDALRGADLTVPAGA